MVGKITKKQSALLTVLAIAILILLAVSGALFLNSVVLSTKLSELEYTKAKCQTNLHILQHELEQTSNELTHTKSELANKTVEIEGLEGQLAQVRREAARAGSESEQLSQELKNALNQTQAVLGAIDKIRSWISTNAEINNKNSTWAIDRCRQGNSFNLACLVFKLGRRYGIKYAADKGDKLEGIYEFLKSGKGDCEDFSMLIKAFLNGVKKERPDLRVLAWKQGTGRFVVYRNDDGSYWYYDNAESIELGKLRGLKPAMVCYGINDSVGHCVVALMDKNITDPGSIIGAHVIEPQTGEYLGTIGNSSISGLNRGPCTNEEYPICVYYIITDDDAWIYSVNSNARWYSLKDVEENLEKVAEQAQNTLNVWT